MIEFGSVKAIIYRNMLLNKKLVFFSFGLILWGFLQIVAFKIQITFLYMILVPIVGLQQQTFYTHSMVEDRHTNFKIIFKIMGLRRNQYFIGQTISFNLVGICMIFLIFICGIFCNFIEKSNKIFEFADLEILGISICYFFLLTFFSICVSYCFKNPQIAKEFTTILYYIVFYYSVYIAIAGKHVLLQYLSPHTFYVKFCWAIFMKERIIYGHFLQVILIQALFYGVLSIYLENIIGGEDDHSKSPLFFLDYFRKKLHHELDFTQDSEETVDIDQNSLNVIGLSKKFGNFTALSNVNIKLEKGKIHCLLGHNGAGKSTFVNLLIGFYKATEGKMIYKNQNLCDLHKGESELVKFGICPPNDILFADLTVYQHLKMMCKIKNIRNIEAVILKTADDLGLSKFLDFRVKDLSGGNKRKLTIAFSIIGDPNIIFFDEPTSALDPVSRKDIWNILLRLKEQGSDKIILLTTHHLEEAERLADNIIFLASGTVKVTGSIKQLKKNFGLGYNIDVFLENDQDCLQKQPDILQKTFPEIGITDSDFKLMDKKLEIRIPLKHTRHIVKILQHLQQNLSNEAILNINTNTLEKAYIEIDKNLHKTNDFATEEFLENTLNNLYSKNPKTNAKMQIYLIAKNKCQFLINDSLELVKLFSQYFIIGASLGFVVFYCHKQKIPITEGLLSGIFSGFVYLELFMSSFSIHNLVYDKSKDIKIMMYANKITPITYYLGKLLADFAYHLIGYTLVFTMIATMLEPELQNLNLKSIFFLSSFKIAMWKMSYLFGGCFFSRFFDSTRNVLNFYPLFYMILNLIGTLFSRYVFHFFVYFNDFLIVTEYLSTPQYGYWQTFSAFCVLSLSYFCLAVTFENFDLKYNYMPDQKVVSTMFKKAKDDVLNLNESVLSTIQLDLKKSVVNEEEIAHKDIGKCLKVLNLSKIYTGKKFALSNVSFGIEEACNFGLIGPNGAGKSTLFNVLLNKIKKTEGNIILKQAKSLFKMANIEFSPNPFIHNNFSVCFQGDSIWEHLTVRRNIQFFADLNQVHKKSLDELLCYFEFENYLDKNAIELSSGNKRKLCIINSLLINPNYLFFDEATCGIDINMRLRMKNIIEFFKRQNKSVGIFTTHFLKDIEIFCDKIGILSNGEFMCVNYIDVIKRSLGGYLSVIRLSNFAFKDELISFLRTKCEVKVISEEDEPAKIKIILTSISKCSDIFIYLSNEESNGNIVEFSFNQLSIEDIYLDVFDRSE